MPPLKIDASELIAMQQQGSRQEEMEVDYDKNITRLYESISSSNWEVAIRAAKRSPEEARTWVVRHHVDEDDGEERIMWRFLPIHSACARQPPEAVISTLLQAYPDGARAQDDQGMYPLHYACGNQASAEVVRLLLLAYPQAAAIADPNGMLPIHYLAQWGPASLSVVDMLLFSNRNIHNARDIDGNTPLDLAKDADYPERDDVVAALQKSRANPTTQRSSTPVRTSTPVRSSTPPLKGKIITNSDSKIQQVQKQQEEIAQQTSATMMRLAAATAKMNTTTTTSNSSTMYKSTTTSHRETFTSNYRPSSSNNLSTVNNNKSSVNKRYTSRNVPDMVEQTNNLALSRHESDYRPSDDYHVDAQQQQQQQQQQVPEEESLSVSNMKLLAKLKAEVNKMRAEQAFAQAEMDEKLLNEREAMEGQIAEFRNKMAKMQEETDEVRTELMAKEEFGRYVEGRLAEKDYELSHVQKERDNLRVQVQKLTEVSEDQRERISIMEERFTALSNSLQAMMEEQEKIIAAAMRQDDCMRTASERRQRKLQELIDQEMDFAKDSEEVKIVDDSGESINDALEKQKGLMDAVSAVLAEGLEVSGASSTGSMSSFSKRDM